MGSDAHSNGETEQYRKRIADLERELRKLREENEGLRDSDSYWRSLVQSAPAYLSVVDREGRLLFLNRTDVGYRPDEILGRSILEATAPEHRQLIQRTLAKVFDKGSTENYEACDTTQHRWYSTMAGPLFRNGEIVAAIQCSEDITDKQEIRRRLAEAESRWRTLLENAPDVIVLFNAEGRVRFVNRTSDSYAPEEIVGEKGFRFLSARDQQPLHEAIGEVFRSGEPREVELTETRGGRVYLARIALLGMLDGEPLAIAICRDITPERKRRQALLDSEARLRLAVQQAPVVLWTTDRQLRFTSSIGAGLRLIPVETGDAMGQSIYEFFGNDDSGLPAIDAHEQALKGRSVEYTQAWYDNVYQAHVEPLRDPEGEIVGVVGVALDITARHATEVQLRQTSSDLEARVRERTVELDALNRQLMQDIEHRRVVETELRESEERFRIIAESLPIAVVIISQAEHQVMYVNQQACDLYGATCDDLYSGRVALPCGDKSINQACLETLENGELVQDFESQSKRADGVEIWLSISMVAIRYMGENAFICGLLDTTQRKEAESQLHQERLLLMRLLDLNERDRQLIAYEIHDGFVQDVTAAVMFLESAEAGLGPTAPQPARQIHQSLELLRESLGEARRLINGLRPPVLEEAGVVPALEELISKMREQFALEIELAASLASPRMAPALEMAVYRIVQEGLTNAHRHSQSTRVRVVIREHEGWLHIEIRDWGVGFDPNRTPKKRYGLTGMQERAKLLGGTTTIESQAGKGTFISVHLPMVAVRAMKSSEWLPLTTDLPLD